ncbi:hypothetical protein T310_5492 [Rasamsonia emersonii CBS 393.64]|uniref:Uncharacterized protein n=1 Tax=Rasamsonia emersonii (strain ATCC 16479 / CBS 393.64 / IMI 116815) TaxID=1408163 RepID=A0A0F4YQH5_RASE3|nr:hypothetical protein T310_5492 [Rasamsonia emersonii CBS 393.64]KKA20504.1 hypothetical protein T310_5492 [Rasamsonia emersonii CBS 393.64]
MPAKPIPDPQSPNFRLDRVFCRFETDPLQLNSAKILITPIRTTRTNAVCWPRLGIQMIQLKCPAEVISGAERVTAGIDAKPVQHSAVEDATDTGLAAPSIRSRIVEVQRQADQTGIRGDAQGRQHDDGVAAGAELAAMQAVVVDLAEELAVALLAAEQADQEHAGAVDGEQGADAVELGGEDLEHDQGERELGQGGAYVGALEGTLGGAHLDHLVRGEHGRAGAVHAQAVAVGGMPLQASSIEYRGMLVKLEDAESALKNKNKLKN